MKREGVEQVYEDLGIVLDDFVGGGTAISTK